jgi:hypothetical protein
MDLKILFQSRRFKQLLKVLGTLVVLLLVFQLGVFVGFRKASFSYRWGDNYHRAFGGPRGGFLRDFEGRDFVSGHGTAGAIVRIDGNNIIIKGRDGVEKIATVTEGTTVRKGRTAVKLADLKADDRVVIIGAPKDDGSIEAKIIRVFDGNQPAPPPHRPGFPWLW